MAQTNSSSTGLTALNDRSNITCPALLSVVIPVFRDGRRAVNAVNAVLQQILPASLDREVIVVDDGSDDDTLACLSECESEKVRILRLDSNQGRSVARNKGASFAKGNIVVFMDCDCVPEDGFLLAHVSALSGGAVASTGHVTGEGRGFWSIYQRDASLRRQRQHENGVTGSGSSQNLAVRKEAFEAVNGFDTNYRHYGFEDRDLLFRISQVGLTVWCGKAVVRHQDQLTLCQVSRKMCEAGQYSSANFSSHHPDAYRALGYAAIDVDSGRIAQVFAPLSGALAKVLAVSFDAICCERWLPYSVSRQIVRVTTALSYLSGTAKRSVSPTVRFP